MKFLKSSVALLMVIFLVGCASVQMASLENDLKAKSFEPVEEKASVYIYRNENFGGAIPMTLNVNGRTIGQTAAKTYFRLNLRPGLYNVESIAENVSTVTLQADAGKNYFIWQEVKMGLWMARSQLSHVDEATGRTGVQESKLAALRIPETDILPVGIKPGTDGRASQTDAKPLEASEKLRQLQKMYEEKLITEQEFNQKRTEIFEKF